MARAASSIALILVAPDGGRRPGIFDVVGQEMPSEDGELAGDDHDRDGVATPECNSSVEGFERTR